MIKHKKLLMLPIILLSCVKLCYAGNALLDKAYSLALSGEIQASEQIYQELLSDSQFPKYEVYLSKCMVDINRLDIIGSDKYYQLAVEALANNSAKDSILLEFNYRRAALLINKGEGAKASLVLTPYVFKENANVRMQSDYLDANFRIGNYDKVVADAKTFWNGNYHDKPIYGIMPVADSLFKLKKYAEAEPVYHIVLQVTPDNFFANLSLAYCLAMRNADQQALDLYDKCYTLHPAAEELLLNEANILFAQGKRSFAKKLYKLLEHKNSSRKNNILLSKAITFGNNEYIVSSNQLLSSFSGVKSQDYWVQRFNNYMNDELYYSASNALKNLSNTPAYNSLSNTYKSARKGGVGVSFSTTSDYKGNSIQAYRLYGDAYIGFNTYLTGILDNSRFSDRVNTATINTTTVGLTHFFERGKISANIANAIAGGTHTLYDLGFTYKIDDLTSVDLLTGKRPIEFAQAVLNNFITEKYYTVVLTHKVNERNSFSLDYTTASQSDSNHFYGYGIGYSYYPVKNDQKTHEFFSYYRRSGFSKLSDFYETPDKRIAYGIGWQGRWNLPNASYWIVRTNFELGYDNLEPTDFSPSIRVQYTYPIAANQELSASIEYGVRTDRLNNPNRFLHGYKLFELDYNINF